MNAATKKRREQEEAWRLAVREQRALRIDFSPSHQTFRSYSDTNARNAAAVELSRDGIAFLVVPPSAGGAL